MFFSVVIPTFERPQDLKAALSALLPEKQSFKQKFEIIVSDDSNDQRSRLLIEREFNKVTWTTGKRNGPAGNRNSGAKIANGEWLIFIDDDCIPESNFIQSYELAILQNPQVSVFEGRIFPDRERKTWAEGCPENSSGGMLWTSNLCIKKNLFDQLGGFDERFRVAYEDVDFAYRIKLQGLQTKFVRNAAVCHPWRSLKKGGKNWKKRGYEIESLELFLEKHGTNELANLRLYFRYLLRTFSTDQIKSIIEFRCKGYNFLLSQIITIISSIFLLIRFEWKEFIKKR